MIIFVISLVIMFIIYNNLVALFNRAYNAFFAN